jgi:hypothetical protein
LFIEGPVSKETGLFYFMEQALEYISTAVASHTCAIGTFLTNSGASTKVFLELFRFERSIAAKERRVNYR